MLRYILPDLPAERLAELRSLQDRVDANATLEAKVDEATALFKRKAPAATFRTVRERLAEAAPPGAACYYCERDRWREIEHIEPKRFYPERCFSWSNYVYSCTICNQDHKKDRYAVFETNGTILEFNRSRPYDDGTPDGDHVLLNIRAEDPLDYLKLDFETGGLAPIAEEGRARARAEFTRDLFDLNADDLRLIRRQAYKAFKNYLRELKDALAAGSEEQASLILSEILDLPSPTVLVEMRRQAGTTDDLTELFDGVPTEVGRRP